MDIKLMESYFSFNLEGTVALRMLIAGISLIPVLYLLGFLTRKSSNPNTLISIIIYLTTLPGYLNN
jgi:hypothetical protein